MNDIDIIKNYCQRLKELSNKVNMPLFTRDEELETLLFQQRQLLNKEKIFNVGTSDRLLNITDHRIMIR